MQRCDTTELLEDPSLPDDVVARAYRDLARTHRWLGIDAAILKCLRKDPRGVSSVLDIGCGQGALLHKIHRELGVRVAGFDLRPAPEGAPVPILAGNAVVDELPLCDVAVCVLMAHHLSESDLIRLIHNVSRSCRRFIVLDLVRHRLPLTLFSIFARPFLSHINVADGLTSIRRSYTPAELRRIVDKALEGSGARVVHTVAPLYIYQIVDMLLHPDRDTRLT
jgi:2-polyprenyl-3-methyl-5-hydroxy-6-metoxy-1,4-benzoquinol methylase